MIQICFIRFVKNFIIVWVITTLIPYIQKIMVGRLLIWTNGEVAVAEQYYNQNGAYFGHEKWMERCEAKPYGIFDVVKCHFC